MVALETPPVQLGWSAPDFSLQGTDGNSRSPKDVVGENGLVIMFICNHCPFVQAIAQKIKRDTDALADLGVNTIAVMSNDANNYPEDSFENMKIFKEQNGWGFPYVIDETQDVARAYDAVCTPDFFGFDAALKLQYRGRLDDSGMQRKKDGTRELFEAMKQLAETGQAPAQQHPSIGCSIKWKNAA